jgi:uncharacterized protein (TIGR00369 family)
LSDNLFDKAVGFGVEIPFVRHLGFMLTVFEGGRSEMRYEALPEHLNSFGVTHGGALMTLLDVSMATAARSVTPDMGVVTIEMKTSFMQPAQGPLIAKGELMHRTATMAFTQSTVFAAHRATQRAGLAHCRSGHFYRLIWRLALANAA